MSYPETETVASAIELLDQSLENLPEAVQMLSIALGEAPEKSGTALRLSRYAAFADRITHELGAGICRMVLKYDLEDWYGSSKWAVGNAVEYASLTQLEKFEEARTKKENKNGS